MLPDRRRYQGESFGRRPKSCSPSATSYRSSCRNQRKEKKNARNYCLRHHRQNQRRRLQSSNTLLCVPPNLRPCPEQSVATSATSVGYPCTTSRRWMPLKPENWFSSGRVSSTRFFTEDPTASF